jgi:hypothetical protein
MGDACPIAEQKDKEPNWGGKSRPYRTRERWQKGIEGYTDGGRVHRQEV